MATDCSACAPCSRPALTIEFPSCTASSDDPSRTTVSQSDGIMLYMERLYKEPYSELQEGTIMGHVLQLGHIFSYCLFTAEIRALMLQKSSWCTTASLPQWTYTCSRDAAWHIIRYRWNSVSSVRPARLLPPVHLKEYIKRSLSVRPMLLFSIQFLIIWQERNVTWLKLIIIPNQYFVLPALCTLKVHYTMSRALI